MLLWSFVYKCSFELTFSFLLGVYATAELLLGSFGASLVAQMVKNLPVLQETWVQFLGRKWQPTPVFLLENSMGRRAWWATVHGVAKSQTQLSNEHFHFHLGSYV